MIFYTNATNSLEVERDIISRLTHANLLTYDKNPCIDTDEVRPCYSIIVIVEELTEDAS